MAFPKTQDLARDLIASQTARGDASAAGVHVAAQVIGELRLHLMKLAGVDGFRSLLARALALAKKEAPSLAGVQVRSDGTLEGFDEIEAQDAASQDTTSQDAGTVLIAHFLQLLVTFIGEPLTLRLVRDVWKDALLNMSPDVSPNTNTSL